jgi:two-component system phosphate regulon sensor histidine kinase PhoR
VRREFVSNVSHELRTPLAIFQGYLENLLENPDLPRAELAEVLGILQRHSTRLNLLVEDLLILARLESRSDALKLEAINAADFLRQIAADWKLRSGEKKITLRVEVAPELTTFCADRFRMEQVFNNLIDNAIKYSERGDEVVLIARKTAEEIQLSVEDNGPGVSSSDLPHIFERFYRVDKARSRSQGGTGLGLSIVKHIAQLHGGCVGAESTYGKGTRITVRLPVERERLRAQPGAEPEQRVDPREHEREASFA